jgi:drug/metabolite transporter (DMT)-like permease
MSQPRVNPYLVVIIGVIGTSFAAIFVRLSTAPFLIIAFYRLFFTIIILSPIFIRLKAWRELRFLSRKKILIIIAAGVLLALHFAFWMASLDPVFGTSIASSVILVDLSSIFAAIFAYMLLKEKLTRIRILGILIAFLGACIIALNDWSSTSNSSLLGDLLALMGALMCALYLVIGRYVRQDVNLIPYVFLLYSACTLTLFFACFMVGHSFFTYNLMNFMLFLALAIVPTIFGHTLYNWALKYVDAAVIGVSLLAEPIGSILLGIVIIGEIPHLLVIAGGILVLGGIYLTFRVGSKLMEKRQ